VVVDAAAIPAGLRDAELIEGLAEEEDAAALAVPLVPSPATTVTAAAAAPEEDAAALAVPLVPSPATTVTAAAAAPEEEVPFVPEPEPATTVTAAAAPAPPEKALVEALLTPAVPFPPLPSA
jgi:hypothetical protein